MKNSAKPTNRRPLSDGRRPVTALVKKIRGRPSSFVRRRSTAKLYNQAGRVSEILAFDNRICFD